MRPHPASLASLGELVAAKRASWVTVSVCLPARDEASTVGGIVSEIVGLVGTGLVDEVLVVDDGSVDGTGDIAATAGARVVRTAPPDGSVQDGSARDGSVPDADAGSGKGEALWTSLATSAGDLVCWVDADIVGFEPVFVSRLLAPLLLDPGVDFVKGYYRRPVGTQPTGGGRTTELVARPLLSLFAPELAEVVQPLSGEYAGRRAVLERVPFVRGWGVDVALLIDVTRQVGVDRLAQVDLGARRHRHRPLEELGPQALAVLMAVLRRADVDVPRRAELVRFDSAHARQAVTVLSVDRPPIADLDGFERFETVARLGRVERLDRPTTDSLLVDRERAG